MTNCLAPIAGFAPPAQLRASTFAASTHTLRRSACSLPSSSSQAPTTMLLGIPRIFAPSSRPKPEETVRIQEPPAPLPPPSKLDQASTWAKAHPLQAVASLSILVFAVQNAIKKAKSTTSTNPLSNSSSSSRSSSSSSSNLSSSSGLKRAVPKKHETTEEALDLLGNTARKYIIVGGKGGVGKTSMSASIATSFADRGQTTLIISTDPAHSLSDAFGQSVSGGDPVAVSSVDNLYAQEIDPDSMKRTFSMMSNMGGGGMLNGMEDMGLDELNSLFDTIPPGFDEAVALVEIVKYIEVDQKYKQFDRIVFDTAPTGHTLRLLSLPDFLNGFFGKIISMKSKFGNIMNQFKGMFGNDVNMDNSVQEMEELKRSMNMVRELFRDEIQTEFIVATIPNMMAIAESQRLIEELKKEKIPVRHLFVNLVQPQNDDCSFCTARYNEHRANIKYVNEQFDDLKISFVQLFDKEVKGAPALRAISSQLFPKSLGAVKGWEKTDSSSRTDGEEGTTKKEDSTPVAKAELVE